MALKKMLSIVNCTDWFYYFHVNVQEPLKGALMILTSNWAHHPATRTFSGADQSFLLRHARIIMRYAYAHTSN